MLVKYIHQSRSTIYKKVSNQTIPHIKMGSRTLFIIEEIDKWVRNGGSQDSNLPTLPNL